MATSSSSVARTWRCSWRVTSQPSLVWAMGTMALPVMSPPMISTSALWNLPAFRNFRQHTSEPWISVAKKILTRPSLRASVCDGRQEGGNDTAGSPPVVGPLGARVPRHRVADAGSHRPAGRLRGVVDGGAQGADLLAHVEA